MQWELAVNHACQLGEGPVWDKKNKTILWVDILNGEIHQLYTDKKEHTITKIGNKISSLVLKSSGGMIGTFENGFAEIDLLNNKIHYIKKVEENLSNNRFNDGKCDPAGRFWAGTMDEVNGIEGAGNLYAMEANYAVSLKVKNVSCSNGLAWSPDCSTFYFIDTPTRRINAYDYDMVTGMISNERVIFDIPEQDGYPDGMTIDTDGMLWIAHWDGWKISRWDPSTGKQLFRVLLPVSRITSCTFGGDKMDEIYITSAAVGLSKKDLIEQPLAGSLFVIKNSGFKGISAYEFPG